MNNVTSGAYQRYYEAMYQERMKTTGSLSRGISAQAAEL